MKLLQKHNTNVKYLVLPPMQTVNHIFDQHGIKLSLDNLLQNNPICWYQALSNEFDRLTQSNDAGDRCTDAMHCIHHSQVPTNNKVAYANFVCDHRPLQSEQLRVCLVIGGDKWTCPYDTGSPAANLL